VVSHSCACIGSPCLRPGVHGASIGGGGGGGGALLPLRGGELLAVAAGGGGGAAVLADRLGLRTLGERKRLGPALRQLSQLSLADRRVPLPTL
jgi:hypothetical protein